MAKKNKSKKTKVPSDYWPKRAIAAREEYGLPVDALFYFGEVGFREKWADYSALGLSEADTPELSRLACDTRLDYADSPVAASAPIHAMRILAQMGNSEFLPSLFQTFDGRDDDDLFHEEMSPLLSAIGAAAIPQVQAFFATPEKSPYSRASISNGLVAMARKYRPLHSQVVSVLTAELSRYEENSEEWNGFLIADLIELAAGETLPLIEKAFRAGAVDEMVGGDLNDVRAEFGLETPRYDSSPRFMRDTRPQLRHPLDARPIKPPKS